MTGAAQIRSATSDDLPALQRLYVDTIRKVANQDYSPAQIAVWAAGIQNQRRWQAAVRDQYFLLATSNNTIVGFGSLDQGCYLDFLYVHHDFQRQGIALALYRALEQEATQQGCSQLTTDASKTAQGFFVGQGFSVVKENHKRMEGVEIVNYRMSKVLQ